MLMKVFYQRAETDEEFRRKLKGRQKILMLVGLLGVAAVIAGIFLGNMDLESHRYSFLSGFYVGAGAGVLAVCIVGSIRIRRVMKDGKRLRSERIKESDERNIDIIRKSGSMAGFVFVYLSCAVMLAAGFFSMEVFWTIWCSLVGYFLIFWGVNGYYKRKG